MRGSSGSLALSSLLLLAACGDEQEASRPPLVETITVGGAASSDTGLSGTVEARIESSLGFRAGGRIVARLVDLGQTVARGQVLMRLDPSDLALAAKAARAAASASDRTVTAAAAQATRAASDARRLNGLVEAGAISAQSYDSARAASASTAAQLSAARADAVAMRAQARVAANQASYAVLRADAAGVVTQVMAEPGQVVAAGAPVLRLAHGGAREVAVDVPEDMRGHVPRLASVRIGGSETAVPATLRQLSGSADPMTRTYEARYQLARGDVPLGATANVLIAGNADAGVAVPLTALHDSSGGPGVWVVRGGRVSFRPVRLGTMGEENAIVTAGLRPGERVVALGAHLLKEGEPVRTRAASGTGR